MSLWEELARFQIDRLDVFVTSVLSWDDMAQRLAHQRFDVIVSGLYYFDDMNGQAYRSVLSLAEHLHSIPVIFIAHGARPSDAFDAAKLGAFDFINLHRDSNVYRQIAESVARAERYNGTSCFYILQ